MLSWTSLSPPLARLANNTPRPVVSRKSYTLKLTTSAPGSAIIRIALRPENAIAAAHR